MPELPEVETVRAQLHEQLKGFVIRAIDIWKTGREEPRGSLFVKKLEGKKVINVQRRGKLLILEMSGGLFLLVHLKMTGRLVFVETPYTPQKHDRIRFEFEDSVGEKKFLVWSDVRTFGFMHVVEQHLLERILSEYGPEPLQETPEALAKLLPTNSKRSVKQCLMDQSILAGIGNIYADEACFRAGILPTRAVSTLTSDERVRVMREAQAVLREAVAQRGTSANDYVDTAGDRGGFLSLLQVYGREGQPCRKCRTPILKKMHAQRGTHWCPVCQT